MKGQLESTLHRTQFLVVSPDVLLRSAAGTLSPAFVLGFHYMYFVFNSDYFFTH